MTAEGWHYFATNLDGDGGEHLIATDLPLSGVQVTAKMSAANALTGSISVEVGRLKGVDFTLFEPWRTCVYAELGGVIRGGGIVTQVDVDDAAVALTCGGFVGYATGMAYNLDKWYAMADPFDIARDFWMDLQDRAHSDIGLNLVCSPDSTPVRLGRLPVEKWPQIHDGYPGNPLPPIGTRFVVWWTENGKRKERYGVATRTYGKPQADGNIYYLLRQRSDGSVTEDDTGDGLPAGYDVLGKVDARTKKPTVDADGEELQPYRINYYDTLDMGQWWDSLAKDGGFDYYETAAWSGETITHTLHVGYPSVGRRRDDLRFEVGVNVLDVPTVDVDGDDYCDWVLVIGAGEGSAAVRGTAAVPSKGRLHRTKVVQDATIKTSTLAAKRAAQLASAYAGDQNVSEIKVTNHPFAPLGSYNVGDTIQLIGSGSGWSGGLFITLRVTAITFSPDSGDVATLSVARPDKVSSEV